MFIACGQFEDGRLRVLDTSDWVVEVVSLEELKLAQASGNHVVFNNKYDFVYKIYEAVKSDSSCVKYLEDMRDFCGFKDIPDLNCLSYVTRRFNKDGHDVVVFFCELGTCSFILFTIQRFDDAYEFVYKTGTGTKLHKFFESWYNFFFCIKV